MKTPRRFGYIVAGPSEFAIHRRRGRTRKMGAGISFLCLPLIDRYYLIPSSAQSLGFTADQITAENQGVEVAGFAVWKIDNPEKASANFDFADRALALTSIGESLRHVVESAIRHQVANMNIDDVLRKRGTIILQLKKELAYMAGQWGLLIETVEIRNVRVLSEQLFKHMQAPFRDKMRLESETSAMETEQRLVEKRLTHREQVALQSENSSDENWSARVRQSGSRSLRSRSYRPLASITSGSSSRVRRNSTRRKQLLQPSAIATRRR